MRLSIWALVAGIALLLVAPNPAPLSAGPGVNHAAQVFHFNGGDTLTLAFVNPDTGDAVQVTGTATRGDFIRLNGDGTYFAHLGIRGDATFDVAAIGGGPEYTGTGLFVYNGAVTVADPDNPLAGFMFAPDKFTLHVHAALTDAGGVAWSLRVKALARNGEIKHFGVSLTEVVE